MHEPSEIWMQQALHDLCQPLTALECRLYLGTLDPNSGPSEMRMAINESWRQCERLMTRVRAMQDRLNEMD